MGAITEFLAADHDRLDVFFAKARGDGGPIDLNAYEEFRRGILRHVGMEELILIPAARRLNGAAVSLAQRTRRDHAALTSLLIPSPTGRILSALSAVLSPHNRMEEEAGGLYEQCERALGAESEKVLSELRAAPDIPPAAHAEGPRVSASIGRALGEAGYAALAEEFHG
jgi:hypothetical protein